MITGAQIRAARGFTRWSTAQLAERAKLARSTIIRAETVDGTPPITTANLAAIQRVLEAAGVSFNTTDNSLSFPRPQPEQDETE